MRLIEKIESNSEFILELWFEKLISVFPETSLKYIRKHNEQFTNPIGFNLFNNLQVLLDCFLKNDNKSDNFLTSLEEVIKLRLIQDISPFEKANIYKPLREIILNKFSPALNKEELIEIYDYFQKFEETSFNKYLEIQELIFDIKKEEIRNRYGKILDRINKRYEKDFLNKNSD